MSARAADGGVTTRRVVVRFKDDEILEGFTSGLDLDQPDFTVTLADPESNSRLAIVPVAAVKSVLLHRVELDAEPDLHRLKKVAIRFWDGEVLKGLLSSDPERHRYGITLPLVSPALDELEVFGIPYAAVKAIYFVKTWDRRRPEYVRETGRWSLGRADTPLLDLLSEIRGLSSLRSKGDISDAEFEQRRRQVLARI